jgi:hypothetical protein
MGELGLDKEFVSLPIHNIVFFMLEGIDKPSNFLTSKASPSIWPLCTGSFVQRSQNPFRP